MADEYAGFVFGKVPPQARDMEETVLGAIMLEPGVFDRVAEILRPECFYVEAHQSIFTAMQRLVTRSMPVDILTVVEELRSSGGLEMAGGPFFITRLTNQVVSSANIEAHARIILQKYMQREMARIGARIVGSALEEATDVFDLLDLAERELFNLTGRYLKREYQPLHKALVAAMKRIDALRSREHRLTGVPSGYSELDAITNGWQPTDLIIIAARPSVGKTAFALNLARNAATHRDKPAGAAIFSLEMSIVQLVLRILSAESEIDMADIANANLTNGQLEKLNRDGVQKLAGIPLYLDDTAGISMFELRAKCRRLVQNHGVGLIIIDYLQLMESDRQSPNREQEIAKISRDLKKMAKDLNVPVIALSQLSREVEKRKGKPQLSDLRESGAIEQDADMVIFLYRPSEEDVLREPELADTGEALIRKHRNGQLGNVTFKVHHNIQKWMSVPDGFIYENKKTSRSRPTKNNLPPSTKMAAANDDSFPEEPF